MYIKITVKRWFQRSYGNTYHSCLVEKCSGTGTEYKKELIGYEPFTYGYGSHYINTAAEILGITENELRQDIWENGDKYCIFEMDIKRKKDL